MMTTISKIGLIQTAPLPGDFSNNLRAIVQGYRECLDHGAELIVAPASALCGLEPRDLANRSSFIHQTQNALDTLSRELGSAPLLLAAYTTVINDDELYVGIAGEDDAEDNTQWIQNNRSVVLTPYLLEKDSVTELENGSSVPIHGTQFYVDTSDEELLPDEPFHFIVRLPDTPWYAGAAQDNEETRKWEASMAGCHVLCCRAVGTAGGNLYGGGSAIYTPDGAVLQRLPFFETAAKVIDCNRKPNALHLPDADELLSQALERGIRDSVRNNCFSGVCLPLDHPHSALLGVLCVEALGAANVCGISFDPENELAKKLGISCVSPQIDKLSDAAATTTGGEDSAALQERMRAAIAISHAESRGMMLLCPLGRREIMLGEFHMYGLSAGHIAPLGNLYDIDIFLLCKHFREQYSNVFGTLTEPPHSQANRIIHELIDLNTPPSALLREDRNYMFKENDVRLIQRKLVASAYKRTQLPLILRVDAPQQRLIFPLSHRLND